MRMKFPVSCVLLGALVLGAVPSFAAEWETIQSMAERCKDTSGGPNSFYCLGMANGVMGMMLVHQKQPNTLRICSEGFVSNGQAIQIFLNWKDKNPTRWQEPAFVGFAWALQESYPCE